jgi:hypothetical protein
MYPFVGGDSIEGAAKGLFLGEKPNPCSKLHLLRLQEDCPY